MTLSAVTGLITSLAGGARASRVPSGQSIAIGGRARHGIATDRRIARYMSLAAAVARGLVRVRLTVSRYQGDAMASPGAQQVLADIFTGTLDLSQLQTKGPVLFTEYEDIVALAELLANPEAREEEFQLLLTERPQLLFGAFGYGQNSDLAFITKPQIGYRYRADFAVLSFDQGGCDVFLIELEPASAALFTQDDTPARRLQGALGQVRDWDQWIRQNQSTFVTDLIRQASHLPVYPERSVNGSFLLVDAERLESTWRSFGGYTNNPVKYSILIGRWSQLSPAHRERLLYLNRNDGALQQIRTYEQIARLASIRRAVTFY